MTYYWLSYLPSKSDPDVWIRPAVKENGFDNEMTLVNVDDIMCSSHDTKTTMMEIQATFKLKDDKTGEKPENHQGAQIMQKVIDGWECCWAMMLEHYLGATIANVEAALDASGQRFPSRATTPRMRANYRPEPDTSAELKLEGMHSYQELIAGVLRWVIELGRRIDIVMEVSMLSTHLA